MESDQIWNQVAKFMQQLRGENLSKKSIIQIPGQKNAKNELEKIGQVILMTETNQADEAYEGKRTKNYSEMDRMLGR